MLGVTSAGLVAGGFPSDGDLLLNWKRSFTGFLNASTNVGFVGWTPDTTDIVCAWTGIACNDDRRIGINMPARVRDH